MISVENFYWILYENLLKPVGLDAFYYYPFGTRENLSRNEFCPLIKKQEHHVLFQFDQEPLWDDNFGPKYDADLESWTSKLVRILANSEHSQLKRQVCRDRGLLDWYFFYHGFAALSWFADSQYLNDVTAISNAYLSMNHLVSHKRSYRLAMLAHLSQRKILRQGQISFHANKSQVQEELCSIHTQLSAANQSLIQNELDCWTDLPMTLDKDQVGGFMSASFGHREYQLWQRSFLHMVNETVFYERKLHLTEKIFKPIVSLRPFVLISAPGNLQYLRSYGFMTFSDWIDESYDFEANDDRRLAMIADEVAKLCNLPIAQLRTIHQEMMPVLEFNKKHFFTRFRDIIVNELVDNFDTCIRVWNNGRIDGRQRPHHPDLERVKQLLLQ